MDEKFSFKWEEYTHSISQSFKSVRADSDYADVALVSDDDTFALSHKLILSTSSSFFKELLKKTSHPSPLLYLGGLSSKFLNYILDYIYEGEVEVLQDDVDFFLKYAQKYKIKGLCSEADVGAHTAMEENINTNLNIDNNETNNSTCDSENMEIDEEENLDSFLDDLSNDTLDELVPDELVSEEVVPNNVTANQTDQNEDTLEQDDSENEPSEQVEGGHKCKICGYTAKFRISLNKHIKSAHIEDESEYQCNNCNGFFDSKDLLDLHHIDCIDRIGNFNHVENVTEVNTITNTNDQVEKIHKTNTNNHIEEMQETNSNTNNEDRETMPDSNTDNQSKKIPNKKADSLIEEIPDNNSKDPIQKMPDTSTNSPLKKVPENSTKKTQKDNELNEYDLLPQNKIVLKDASEIPKKIQELLIKDGERYKCKVCGFTTRTEFKGNQQNCVVNHIETHFVGIDYQCKYCKRFYRTRSSLQTHTYLKHKWAMKADKDEEKADKPPNEKPAKPEEKKVAHKSADKPPNEKPAK